MVNMWYYLYLVCRLFHSQQEWDPFHVHLSLTLSLKIFWTCLVLNFSDPNFSKLCLRLKIGPKMYTLWPILSTAHFFLGHAVDEMLVKDTVIVTDSDFDLLTIKFADTINPIILWWNILTFFSRQIIKCNKCDEIYYSVSNLIYLSQTTSHNYNTNTLHVRDNLYS